MAYIIKFVGGCHDGKCLSTDFEDVDKAILAESFYRRFTRDGTIGKRFSVISDESVDSINNHHAKCVGLPNSQRHVYEVIERSEDNEDVIVRCKYVGPEAQ